MTKRKIEDSPDPTGPSSKKTKANTFSLEAALDPASPLSSDERMAALEDHMTKEALKALCKERGVSCSGLKSDLTRKIVGTMSVPGVLATAGTTSASSVPTTPTENAQVNTEEHPRKSATPKPSGLATISHGLIEHGINEHEQVDQPDSAAKASCSPSAVESVHEGNNEGKLKLSSQKDPKAKADTRKGSTSTFSQAPKQMLDQLYSELLETLSQEQKPYAPELKRKQMTEVCQTFCLVAERVFNLTRAIALSMNLEANQDHSVIENLERVAQLVDMQQKALSAFRNENTVLRQKFEEEKAATHTLQQLSANRGLQLEESEGIIAKLQRQLRREGQEIPTIRRVWGIHYAPHDGSHENQWSSPGNSRPASSHIEPSTEDNADSHQMVNRDTTSPESRDEDTTSPSPETNSLNNDAQPSSAEKVEQLPLEAHSRDVVSKQREMETTLPGLGSVPPPAPTSTPAVSVVEEVEEERSTYLSVPTVAADEADKDSLFDPTSRTATPSLPK